MGIADNLAEITGRMADSAAKAGRNPDRVKLLAVSKTKPAQAVIDALAAGQVLFGENYIQESQTKIPEVGPGPIWHFIGHLQSNKAKPAAQLFDVIQTVDRVKLARALDRHAAAAEKTLEVLLQVNVGGEVQKSGCTPREAMDLAEAVAGMDNLRLKGLMTMPPFFDDPDRARPFFSELRELSLSMAGRLPDGCMDELSMGMSGDFEAAIEEGATIVRVGTSVFGARVY